ncbi:FeoB-associated Cys-rich membrane protein [Pontibacter sp. BAB1700]|uniref:FeoB-associated Cys-rich membrane protein n=1 Tax=Pontibacter sp. BAB1700 TaxID=1144253 RepID=UPI00026BE988|nr:FeoB-associated Cys-rich membrane protein [Pontibacter sp. BAB1700]EJF08239.1 hypothetical protein O71_22029 [Pontibacter sp. BAB1700]
MEQSYTSYFAGLGLVGIIVGMVLLVFVAWSVVWSYKDARRRGKSPWLVALMVLLMVWPVGLVIWFLLRPQKTEQQV